MLTEAPTAPAGSGPHGVIKAVRRLGWGVADQGISSLSNFALGLFVARSFGASNFGAFTLAYITYTVVINAARGLSTDPLVVRYSGDISGGSAASGASHRWRRATSAATGTALVVGVAAGVVCVVVGLLLPDPVGPVFVALGVGLPALTLQDSWRFAFFACGRGASAFLNDLFWTVLLVLVLVVLHTRGDGSAARCLLVFGGTAALAALLGAVQARVLPRPIRAVWWLRAHHEISVRYLVENLSISGASQLRAFVLGAAAGLAAVGYVRASEILMGPFFVVLMGISQVAVPEASRIFHRNSAPPRALLFHSWWSAGRGSRCVGVDPHDRFPTRPWTCTTYGALDANCTTTSGDHPHGRCGLIHHRGHGRLARHGPGTPQLAGAADRVSGVRHRRRDWGNLGRSPRHELGCDGRTELLRAGVVASASVGTRRSPLGGGGGQVSATPAVPRLTLGLPVYNGERYLAASLDALLAQTFTDFELIISDNGSTDRTAEIARHYAAIDPPRAVRASPAEPRLDVQPQLRGGADSWRVLQVGVPRRSLRP